MSKKILIIDPDFCTGCMSCVIACSLIKEGVVNPEKARLSVLKMESLSLASPLICEQCENAPCENICPTRAITRDSKTGSYIVNPERCIGCKECVWICPFGAITFRGKMAIKCDLCRGDPECSKVCAPGAIRYAVLDTVVLKKKWALLKKRVSVLATIIGEN
jgi:Fe-S-cluster-containing hydrogenase component 2